MYLDLFLFLFFLVIESIRTFFLFGLPLTSAVFEINSGDDLGLTLIFSRFIARDHNIFYNGNVLLLTTWAELRFLTELPVYISPPTSLRGSLQNTKKRN